MCEIYHQLATFKPFIVSAYYSGSTPSSAEIYLDDFVKELDDSCENGILIVEEKFEVRIKCFTSDGPARSFVKCCKDAGGYYAYHQSSNEQQEHDTSKYTAKEFRFSLLYSGPMVLKDILEENQYKHFLLLHDISRILCSRDLYKRGCYAKVYLERFALLGEILYGLVSLTVHILPHVVDDTVNMDCPVTDIDAFPFENQMGFAKKHIRGGFKPLAQLCTKVERDLGIINKRVCIPPELQVLKTKVIDNAIHVEKLIYKSLKLSVKPPNNFVFMSDGSLNSIKDSIYFSLKASAREVLILSVRRKLLGPVYEYPKNSAHLGIYRVDEDDEADTI
ncbi:hypothetical protein QAD02_012485 [Eretmocerus hayati]|uniref:Uncharacterized protein n=1 Tax=Eretmocerus hayati TaxID=131215 RepID=A0ACC2P0P3_9HYME|nr:hypothetical protein QAD02_012485 [Eretmocerus hayati]